MMKWGKFSSLRMTSPAGPFSMTLKPTGMIGLSPTNQTSASISGTHCTLGIVSPHFALDIRDVHRSGASTA